jgi:hypothetical protein
MKKKRTAFRTKEFHSGILLFMALAFVLGGLGGCMFAGSVSGTGTLAVSGHIEEFMAGIRGNSLSPPGFLAAAWAVLRWPILLLLLSMTSAGLIGIPLLFFARGFLFAFCVASFVVVLGSGGVLLAILLLGVESLLTISALFVLGIHGLTMASWSVEERKKCGGLRSFWRDPALALRHAICLVVFLFCIFWEMFLGPLLLSSTAALF